MDWQKCGMNKFRNKYRIESTRLKNWDYSNNGAYFITICTKGRENYFGEIIGGKITNTKQLKICIECWLDLPNHYPNCILDVFVVMPNHVHGVIIIKNGGGYNGQQNNDVETIHELSLRQSYMQQNDSMSPNRTKRRNMLIPKIIGRFKMRTAKLINQYQKTEGIPFWQKNYYDHIIRNESDLTRVRQYIQDNPINWDTDRNNPKNFNQPTATSA